MSLRPSPLLSTNRTASIRRTPFESPSAVLLALLVAGPASAQGVDASTPGEPEQVTAPSPVSAARTGPYVSLQPGVALPGDAVLVTVYGTKRPPQGKLGGRPLKFFPFHSGYQALLGLSTELEAGELELAVKVGSQSLNGALEVLPPQFPRRELKVSSKFISPPASVKKRMAEDKEAFRKAFAQPSVARLFDDPFDWPRLSYVTAPFGDLRTFNGKKKSQHYGIDLDGAVGSPIRASNDGTVVMARDNYASGNTVLIHHGLDLYTAYFHLSKIEVKDGDKVKRGQQLGLVGMTGRVTGPHLHWGAKVDGLWVDAASVMRLDFD